jgi:hypothetical protein
MIRRQRRGQASPANADAYEAVVRSDAIPGDEARSIPGLRHIDLIRRVAGDGGKFTRLMWDEELSHVRPAARALPKPFDRRCAAHFDVPDRRYKTGAPT